MSRGRCKPRFFADTHVFVGDSVVRWVIMDRHNYRSIVKVYGNRNDFGLKAIETAQRLEAAGAAFKWACR